MTVGPLPAPGTPGRLPELRAVRGPVTSLGARVVALPTRPGEDGVQPGPGTADVVDRLSLDIARLLTQEKAKGEVGEVVAVPVAAGSEGAPHLVLLVGVGDASPVSLRRAGAALARRVKGRGSVATTAAADADDEALRAFCEGFLLASYTFSRKSTPPSNGAVDTLDLVLGRPDEQRPVLERAATTARAVWLARDLANTPANEKSPHWLAARAQEVAREAGLLCRVRDEEALAQEGFGGIVAVGMGSARPPRLIELTYTPDDVGPTTPHIVLVGKGIVFDTGGLSLKPREAMVPMKADMAGGGAVIAVLGALREAGVPLRVTGLVAAAENSPSGTAQRPGDVITQYGGRTVEVFNTDAEGRLVLADALAYADATLDPDVVVDVATLTGAASLGLSRKVAALYATDEALASALLAASAASGDRLWRMPLVDDYREALDSDVADLANIARDRTVGGGSITAALFLREFTGGRPWAHLDIAGPGKVDSDEHEVTKGGTGFGVRLLLRWLEDEALRIRQRT